MRTLILIVTIMAVGLAMGCESLPTITPAGHSTNKPAANVEQTAAPAVDKNAAMLALLNAWLPEPAKTGTEATTGTGETSKTGTEATTGTGESNLDLLDGTGGELLEENRAAEIRRQMIASVTAKLTAAGTTADKLEANEGVSSYEEYYDRLAFAIDYLQICSTATKDEVKDLWVEVKADSSAYLAFAKTYMGKAWKGIPITPSETLLLWKEQKRLDAAAATKKAVADAAPKPAVTEPPASPPSGDKGAPPGPKLEEKK